MTQQVSVGLEDQEKKQLLKFFETLDTEVLKNTAKAISMMVRAFEGKPIEPEDIITKMTNIKNILERSRFPTYPLVAKQVYLRLITEYHPECKAFEKWADLEAEALISYKGQSRAEYVEVARAASVSEAQEFYLGEGKPRPQPKTKTHFWNRKTKEESEFENQ